MLEYATFDKQVKWVLKIKNKTPTFQKSLFRMKFFWAATLSSVIRQRILLNVLSLRNSSDLSWPKCLIFSSDLQKENLPWEKNDKKQQLRNINNCWQVCKTLLLMEFFSLVPWGILFACMYYIPKKRIQGFFPPVCFHLAYSRSVMPAEGVGTVKPNWCDRSRFLCRFPTSLSCTSNLKLTTPHLFSLSVRFPTIFPALWSSII